MSRIKEDNLFEKGLKSAIDGISSSIDKQAEVLKSNSKYWTEYAKAIAEAGKAEATNIKTAIESEKLAKEAQRTLREKIKNEQELEKVEQQRIRTADVKAKAEAAEQKRAEQLTRRQKQLTSEYSRQSKEVRRLKNESKDLGVRLLELERNGKRNTKEWRNLSRVYRQTTKEANRLGDELVRIDRNVKDGHRTIGLYERGTRGLTRALSTLGVAFGVREVIRSTTSVIVDFDQAITDLSAISGKSAEELKPLNEQAKQLGATTQFTATEITNLQIELAKLGFTTDEILNSTGGIADFAAATGVEIPRAAALGGSALRAFGLDATEIDRVVSTLGVATTKTALDFAFLETGLSTVAPVARTFGFSIEETTALLGQLANSGFDASSAATATRNILLNLADSNGALAQSLGKPVTNINELSEGLIELQNRGIDLAETLELTDKRSVAAFNTFIQGAGDIGSLSESITGVNQELNDMATKRLNSVSGQLKLLNSAWEGYILNTSEAANTTNTLKEGIGFLANNLPTIIDYVIKAGKYFLLWRVQVALLGKDLSKLNLGNLLKTLRGLPALLINTIKGFKAGSISARSFGTALKSIPLFAVIGLVTELVSWLGIWTDETETATEAESQLNDELERGNQIRRERLKQDSDIESRISRLNELNANQTKALISDLEQQISSYEKLRDIQETEIIVRKDAVEQTRQEIDSLNQKGSTLVELENGLIINQSAEAKLNAEVREGALLNKSSNELLKEGGTITEDYNAILNRYNSILDAANRRLSTFNSNNLEQESALKRAQKALKAHNETIENYVRLTTQPDDKYLVKLQNRREELEQTVKALKELISGERLLGDVADEIPERLTIPTPEVDEEQLEINNDIERDYAEKRRESSILQNESLNEDLRAIYKDRIDTARSSVDLLNSITDSRIDKLNEEDAAAKRNYDNLVARTNGATDIASESLAKLREIEQQNELRRQQLEKRKVALQAASTVLDTFDGFLQQDPQNPSSALAKTATNVPTLVGVVSTLINSLPSFDVGAEYLDGKGQNVDGKGGFLAINHPKERIVPADINEQLRGIPNTELPNLGAIYKGMQSPVKYDAASQLMQGQYVTPSQLEQALGGVKDAIKDNSVTMKSNYNTLTKTLTTMVQDKFKTEKNKYIV